MCCPSPTVESGETACKDGIDNDCDGTLDCAETACSTLYVCTCGPSTPEDGTLPASCLDGKDNDCDHLTDCEETTDCAFTSNCCTKTPAQRHAARPARSAPMASTTTVTPRVPTAPTPTAA